MVTDQDHLAGVGVDHWDQALGLVAHPRLVNDHLYHIAPIGYPLAPCHIACAEDNVVLRQLFHLQAQEGGGWTKIFGTGFMGKI